LQKHGCGFTQQFADKRARALIEPKAIATGGNQMNQIQFSAAGARTSLLKRRNTSREPVAMRNAAHLTKAGADRITVPMCAKLCYIWW
jgi:hypothetical protein